MNINQSNWNTIIFTKSKRLNQKKSAFSLPLIILIILSCSIITVNAGTITGSVSFTPTTIRESAVYTFQLTNSRNLTANEVSLEYGQEYLNIVRIVVLNLKF